MKLKKNIDDNDKSITDFINQLDDMIVTLIHSERIKEKNKIGPGAYDILEAENGKNLKKLLLMKADKIDLEKLYELKSDKNETANMVGC